MPPPISTTQQNTKFIRELQLAGAEFLVIGGAAAAIHGVRETMFIPEIDLLVAPTVRNGRCIHHALDAVHISPQFRPEDVAKPQKRIPVFHLGIEVDILTPVEGVEYSEIIQRSEPAALDILPVRVIGLDDLIDMKKLATVEGDCVEKHRADLERLIEMKRSQNGK